MFENVGLVMIVFVPILLLAYVTTRYIGGKTGKSMKGKYIRVVETVSLGPDKQVHLLKVGEQFVLVSASGRKLEFLTTVTLEDYKAEELVQTNMVFDFKSLLDKYLTAFKEIKERRKPSEAEEFQSQSVKSDAFRNNLNKLKTLSQKVGALSKEDGDDVANES